MENILLVFIVVVGIIVITSILNEKKLHIPHDIALVLGAFLIGIGFIIFQEFNLFGLGEVLKKSNFLQEFHLDHFLLECVLGFIMFASASKLHFKKFMKNILPIGYLVSLTSIISTGLYGILFYGLSCWLGLEINLWICILLGGILSTTDPLPVIGILNKLGVSKSIVSVMEGESLFNDGIAAATFVFVTEWLRKGTMKNFALVILKEFLGAILVGVVVSYLLFKLLKMTNEPINHIMISLLTVSTSYVICEQFGFSGVSASVVCGMYFSYHNKKIARWREVVDSKDLYYDFWSIVENLLNSVLFVLVGLSVISIEINWLTLLLIPIAIIANLITRITGVAISTLLIGKKNIPGHYSFKDFITLMTWGGLKGGISLAFIMSTRELIEPRIYNILVTVTMITILFTTIVQGLTISKVYHKIEDGREEKRIRLRN